MKNRVKILVALLVAIVVFSGIGFYFYQRGNSDIKIVTVEVVSKRDGFNGKENFKTKKISILWDGKRMRTLSHTWF